MDNRTELRIALIGLAVMIIIYLLAYEKRNEQISEYRRLSAERDVTSLDYEALRQRCSQGEMILFHSPQCQGCLAAGRYLAGMEKISYYDVSENYSSLPLEYVPALMMMKEGEIEFAIGLEQIRKELQK